jgi:hypothetical protein
MAHRGDELCRPGNAVGRRVHRRCAFDLRIVPLQRSEFAGTSIPDMLLTLMIALLVFFIAKMDHPYRGANAIGPGAYEIVFRNLTDFQSRPGSMFQSKHCFPLTYR